MGDRVFRFDTLAILMRGLVSGKVDNGSIAEEFRGSKIPAPHERQGGSEDGEIIWGSWDDLVGNPVDYGQSDWSRDPNADRFGILGDKNGNWQPPLDHGTLLDGLKAIAPNAFAGSDTAQRPEAGAGQVPSLLPIQYESRQGALSPTPSPSGRASLIETGFPVQAPTATAENSSNKGANSSSFTRLPQPSEMEAGESGGGYGTYGTPKNGAGQYGTEKTM